MNELKVKKLHQDAKLPQFAHPGDAGMDLFALERTVIAPRSRVQVRTGIAMEFPPGFAALIWDKSGLSHKHGLKQLGGVFDAGYRGEYLIGLANLSDEAYTFEKHDKICQVLIQRVEHPVIVEAETLTESVRGTGGFGSTGKS